MGSLCSSCCGRRQKSQEKQPLLRANSSLDDLERPPKSELEKCADILAALRAGKLPTQDQVNHTIQIALRSEVLDVGKVQATLSNIQIPEAGGDLDESGRKVVEDARQVLEAVLQIGLEKNDDNLIQDVIYRTRRLDKVPVHVDPAIQNNEDIQTIASAIPSTSETQSDFRSLLRSSHTLLRLLLTSTAFRVLLSDVLTTLREITADIAADVGQVAERVEDVAEVVEEAIRPVDEDADLEKPRTADGGAFTMSNGFKTDPNKTTRDVTLDRLESIIRQAHQNPEYHTALLSVLHVFQKYAGRMEEASTAIQHVAEATDATASTSRPVVTLDPSVSKVLADLKLILERFASKRPLDRTLELLSETIYMVLTDPSPAARDYFHDVSSYLELALTDPAYAPSRKGRERAESLYDRGRALLQSSTPLSNLIRSLFHEIDEFTTAMKTDRTTTLLINSLSSLSDSLKSFFYDSAEQATHVPGRLRKKAVWMFVGWVLPRLMRVIRWIPMPRVEVVSEGVGLEAAVDAMLLVAEASSFLPDCLRVVNVSEVRMDAVEYTDGEVQLSRPSGSGEDGQGSNASTREAISISERASHIRNIGDPSIRGGQMRTYTRTRVHVDGLRIGAHDVGYYVRYKGLEHILWFLGYEDEGLVSLDVGRHGKMGEGLVVDLEVETRTNSHADLKADEKLFNVTDLKIDVPGLSLRIDKSRHWILNKMLLQPFAGPIGRRVVEWIVAGKVRGLIEGMEEKLRGAKDEVGRRQQDKMARGEKVGKEPGWADWWEVIIGGGSDGDSNEDEESDTENQMETETHTNVNLKGIVRTSVTHPAGEPPSAEEDGSEQDTQETVIAIGLGPQILPGKGEPLALDPEGDSVLHTGAPSQVARDALGEVQGKVDDVKETIDEGVTAVQEADVRGKMEGLERRVDKGIKREKKSRGKGWRSDAFDL